MKNDCVMGTRAFLESIAKLQDDSLGRAMFYELDTVDSKTSSLLTHVSLMMAVLSVFYSGMKDAPFFKSAILIELIVYLFVTLGVSGAYSCLVLL